MSFDWEKARMRQEMRLPQVQTADLTGRYFVVTGANTGIGYEVAKYLAQHGAKKVIIACRNTAKGHIAVEKIVTQTSCPSDTVECWHLELSSFASVRAFVDRYKESGMPLDVLVNNAGMHSVGKQTTEDGLDILMQVNHISPFLLTMLLLPLLKARGTHVTPARIVFTTSEGASLVSFPESTDTKPVSALSNKQFTREEEHNHYFTSKLLNIICASELARILRAEGAEVVVACANPGLVATELGKKDIKGDNFQPVDLEERYGMKPRTPYEGAKTVLVPVVHRVEDVWKKWSEREGVSEDMDGMPVFESMEVMQVYPAKAQDGALRRRVWEDTFDLMGRWYD